MIGYYSMIVTVNYYSMVITTIIILVVFCIPHGWCSVMAYYL